ncbi:monovalent cation/H+ antiporter complex subunit F [Cognatiyoonia sp. IB215446]|uniref:monovalent cation/H+ antiporter complex subunit F n=1 Tax=Cognatiyoonia sp. IB215446 TaxID=3097355 RepID=UPI002A13AEC6|nr:monovalent cation/H+ antiporter complex subunit F [Cognatiyoonia sp. IB215446]MDX8349099.1 monovalent cation/H+ antiporter complex subunit F [Cognatiyoonia sp. IB215446]
MTLTEFLILSKDIALIVVVLSLAVAFVRLARGPSLADRVVALDMMTVSLIAVCGVLAISTGELALLDVALVLALVGFLATVALARYAERRQINGEDEDD